MEPRWHPSSEEHIAHRGINWDDVVEALTSPTVIRPADADTLKVLGRTGRDRILAVFVSPDPGGRTVYVVTARDATDKERALLRRRERKG